jgi:prepilin-type processing-associated H-X9-DG protein
VRASKLGSTVALWAVTAVPVWAACETITAASQSYTACRFEPGEVTIEVRNLDKNGEPFQYLSTLANDVAANGKTLRFAMNAGMYDDNQRPIGLYVENGRQVKKLNRRNGAGNFHLKPNGVFYVKDGKVAVLESDAYAKSGLKPDFASQSGPMLVINGKIHPKFSPTGTSRKLRNGVGVDDTGAVTFVISESTVTFWEFATLFKDDLGARNALFFDGSVSSLYAPEINRNDGFLPLGPMVAVTEKE